MISWLHLFFLSIDAFFHLVWFTSSSSKIGISLWISAAEQSLWSICFLLMEFLLLEMGPFSSIRFVLEIRCVGYLAHNLQYLYKLVFNLFLSWTSFSVSTFLCYVVTARSSFCSKFQIVFSCILGFNHLLKILFLIICNMITIRSEHKYCTA